MSNIADALGFFNEAVDPIKQAYANSVLWDTVSDIKIPAANGTLLGEVGTRSECFARGLPWDANSDHNQRTSAKRELYLCMWNHSAATTVAPAHQNPDILTPKCKAKKDDRTTPEMASEAQPETPERADYLNGDTQPMQSPVEYRAYRGPTPNRKAGDLPLEPNNNRLSKQPSVSDAVEEIGDHAAFKPLLEDKRSKWLSIDVRAQKEERRQVAPVITSNRYEELKQQCLEGITRRKSGKLHLDHQEYSEYFDCILEYLRTSIMSPENQATFASPPQHHVQANSFNQIAPDSPSQSDKAKTSIVTTVIDLREKGVPVQVIVSLFDCFQENEFSPREDINSLAPRTSQATLKPSRNILPMKARSSNSASSPLVKPQTQPRPPMRSGPSSLGKTKIPSPRLRGSVFRPRAGAEAENISDRRVVYPVRRLNTSPSSPNSKTTDSSILSSPPPRTARTCAIKGKKSPASTRPNPTAKLGIVPKTSGLSRGPYGNQVTPPTPPATPTRTQKIVLSGRRRETPKLGQRILGSARSTKRIPSRTSATTSTIKASRLRENKTLMSSKPRWI